MFKQLRVTYKYALLCSNNYVSYALIKKYYARAVCLKCISFGKLVYNIQYLFLPIRIPLYLVVHGPED